MVSVAGFKILVAYFSFRDIMVIPTFLEESEQFEDSSRRLTRSGRGEPFHSCVTVHLESLLAVRPLLPRQSFFLFHSIFANLVPKIF